MADLQTQQSQQGLQTLQPIIAKVESELSTFYDFALQANASEHLVTKTELHRSLGDDVRTQAEFSARGGVWLAQSGNAGPEPDEMFIGVHFCNDIAEALHHNDPLRQLSDLNIDAFCVVVEEVSHFHLLVNRAVADRQVSKLELEWQGEIDKLLVCGLLLREQHGDEHLLQLARRLYDTAVISAADYELYWEATKYAARFWFAALRTESLHSPRLREFLKRSYSACWQEKIFSLEPEQFKFAS